MQRLSVILFIVLTSFICSVVNQQQQLANEATRLLNAIDSADSREEIDQLRGERGQYVSETCYIPPGRETCAPHFIIPGSMKCGTTSLYAYLTNHPQVEGLKVGAALQGRPILAQKEIRFLSGPLDSITRKSNISNALNQYYDLFDPISPTADPPMIAGDATPMYVCKISNAKRAYYVQPHAKIILMVRDPVERIYSEFFFKRALGRGSSGEENTTVLFPKCAIPEMRRLAACDVAERAEEHNFNYQGLLTCLSSKNSAARKDKCQTPETEGMCVVGAKYCSTNSLLNSFYAIQVAPWLKYFGDNVKVVKSEDFYSNTPAVMAEICEFLGIGEFDWTEVTHHVYNIVNPGTLSAQNQNIVTDGKGLAVGQSESSNPRPPMEAHIKQELREFFTPLNEALATLLNTTNFWPYDE